MTREIIALGTGIIIMGFAMHQFVKAQNVKTGSFLAFFAIFTGFIIINHDVIEKVKIGDFEFQRVVAQIEEAKEEAIEEVEQEAKEAEQQITQLNESAKNLTLDYVKLVQLQNSKEDNLTSREMQLINKQIEDESIKILEAVIPDESERQEWIKEFQLIPLE